MAKSKAQYFYTWYATPVVVDNYPHFDSAVIDDRSIDPVYRFPCDNIYAISLSGIRDIKTNYDDEPTAKQLLALILSGQKKYKIQGISFINIKASIINSRQRRKLQKLKPHIIKNTILKALAS